MYIVYSILVCMGKHQMANELKLKIIEINNYSKVLIIHLKKKNYYS